MSKQGTTDKPWQRKTPPGKLEFEAYLDAVPPILEALGLAEVEHGPRNNRMRARARKKRSS